MVTNGETGNKYLNGEQECRAFTRTSNGMARSANADKAIAMYDALQKQQGWTKSSAWKGIARLLLTCDVWQDTQWRTFHDFVVYREVSDFKPKTGLPNIYWRRGESLSNFLATQLGVPRRDLCNVIGAYWKAPGIRELQPHNLLGDAFRSLTVHILETFGDPAICYAEEVNAYEEFPGYSFATRSRRPRIDIVARRGTKTVALISSRWRFRHDRVDVVEEALSYASAARRQNPSCRLYASIGELSPSRVEKILMNCPPAQPHGPLNAAVHFHPELITVGLGENGRMAHLASLEWLIDDTFTW